MSVPEVGARLGVRDREVRTALQEGRLLGVRRGENNALVIDPDFLIETDQGWQILKPLAGTITICRDQGGDDEEIYQWLTSEEPELGETPLAALRGGRIHAVRRCARTYF